jgi:hypothetical protein
MLRAAPRWLLGGLLLCAASVEARSPVIDPARTWVFVVGTLEWSDAESFAPFPKEGRRDAELVELLRSRGVPSSQIVYLQDRKATGQAIRSELTKLLARTRPGDLLILYYCGHGYKDEKGTAFFASYDAGEDHRGWAMAEIPRALEAGFKGDRALLLADACYSGVLAREVKRFASRLSFAVFTSSSASALSTGNWTFTEAFLDGLRGMPGVDADRDGSVTLGETASHVLADMAVGEEQLATFTTTGSFESAGTLAPAKGSNSNRRIGERVEALDEGEWWKARVVDVRDGAMKLHWLGIGAYDDEWVETSRVRPLRATQGYAPGTTVEAEWKGKWYSARILEAKAGVHLIHYDGYSKEWDEWVSAKRLRLPR